MLPSELGACSTWRSGVIKYGGRESLSFTDRGVEGLGVRFQVNERRSQAGRESNLRFGGRELLSFTATPRHGLLVVYFVFPFWHAKNGQKRNSRDTLQGIKIRANMSPFAKIGPGRRQQACQIGQDPGTPIRRHWGRSLHFAYQSFKNVWSISSKALLLQVLYCI